MKNLSYITWLLLSLQIILSAQVQAQPHLTKTDFFGGSGYDGIFTGYPTAEGWLLVATTTSTDGTVSCTNTSVRGHTWVIQLDTADQVVWQQCYPQNEGTVPWFIEPYGDGTYIIFGESREDTTLLPCHKGSDDLWLLHIDSLGQQISQHCFGGSAIEKVYDFRKTSQGTYIVAARSHSSDGDLSPYYASTFVEDAWVFELDSFFNITWSLQWGGTSYDQANAIAEHPHGGYVVAANSNSSDGDVSTNTGKSDPWLLRLDTAGQVVWQKHYGKPTHEDNLHLLVDSAGYSYLAMESDPIQGVKGGADIRLMKIDTQGNVVYDTYVGGNWEERIDDFKWLEGNLLIAGGSNSTGDGVPGNYGGQDIWLAVVDTQLQVLRSNHYGGSSSDRVYSIQIQENRVKSFGFTKSVDYDFSSNPFNIGPSGKWVGIFCEWISYPVGIPIPDKQESIGVQLYPNPSNGTFQLVLDEEVLQKAHGKVDYQVLDSTGRTVHTGNISSIVTSVNLPALPAGVYLLDFPRTAYHAIPILIQYP